MAEMTAAAPKTGRHQRSVKNYLIDSRFQLKYTSYIVGLTLVISGALGAFLFRSSDNVVGQSKLAVSESQRAVDESKKLSEVVGMNIREQYAGEPALASQFKKDAEEADRKYIERGRALQQQHAELEHRQMTMRVTLIGTLALLVILIGMLGIYFTHKVAGPIFKMKQLLRQAGEGQLNFSHRLRKGDELKEFFEVFLEMVAKMRSRQAREVELLESILSQLDGNNADGAKQRVTALLEEMRKARDA